MILKSTKNVTTLMRIRFQDQLLLLNISAILLIIVVTFFPSNVLRIILGLPFVLFFSGYVLVATLFPRRNALGSIERVAFSFGLSIAVVVFIGLILNYTPWGVVLYPILVSLTIFIALASIVSWHQQRRLAEAERLTVSFDLSLPTWRGQSSAGKILSIILIVAILGAIGALSYVLTIPKTGEKFTEFYVLGLEGKSIDYPRKLKVGEESRVIVGIINREHEAVSYRLEVRIDNVSNNHVGPLELTHDERWEEIVSFTPHRAGYNENVEFLLYRSDESEPYLKLRLFIDVEEQK